MTTVTRLGGVNAQPTALARLRSLALTPAQLVPLALAQLGALWLIVGTGAAVRLTDSGLGCRHWPGCQAGHPLPAKSAHAFVEFGNRLVGAVTIAITLIVWLAARRTRNLPRRAVTLSLAVFLGTLAQAPIGLLAIASHPRGGRSSFCSRLERSRSVDPSRSCRVSFSGSALRPGSRASR
jgi:heme A synthase